MLTVDVLRTVGTSQVADAVTRRKEDGAGFFCPNGHELHYPQGMSAEVREDLRLQAALDQAQAQLGTRRRKRPASI